VTHRGPCQPSPFCDSVMSLGAPAQRVAGTSEGAESSPGASGKPQAEGELSKAEAARVGEVLEHRSGSISAADSPRGMSPPFPNNSRPGTGNGGEKEGKEGRVGRNSPRRYLGHSIRTGRLLRHAGARRQVSWTGQRPRLSDHICRGANGFTEG